MRKCDYILFSGLFLVMLMTVAAPFLYQLKITFLKMDAGERMENSHLQTIRIPLSAVHWIKKGKEILINKRLFDVKEYNNNDCDLVLTGIFDDEETALDKSVDDLWQQQQDKPGILLIKCFQVLDNTCFLQTDWQLKPPVIKKEIYERTIYYPLKDIFIKIPSPPPQDNDYFS